MPSELSEPPSGPLAAFNVATVPSIDTEVFYCAYQYRNSKNETQFKLDLPVSFGQKRYVRDNSENIMCSFRKMTGPIFLLYDSMDNHVGTIKNKFKLFGKNSIWMEFKNKTTGKQERLEYLDLKRGDRQVIYNDRVIANISKRPDCDVTWAKTGLQNICKCRGCNYNLHDSSRGYRT